MSRAIRGCAAGVAIALLCGPLWAQAANVLHFTEAFDNAYWTTSNVTVTANSTAAPAFAGGSAGLGDTITDGSASQGELDGTYETIANDSSTWFISLYILKDAITSRFPLFFVQMAGGSGVFGVVSINTSTGATANNGGGNISQGSVDVDPWWRVWVSVANNSSGNTVARLIVFPAYSSTLGGGADGTLTGSVIAWGANLTNAASLQTYAPDPFYSFASTPTFGLLGVGK